MIDANKGPITAKVASILTERELTLNRGSKDGVKSGMKFKVLAKDPIEIFDPETNAKLGIVDREKVMVMASSVAEKFTICRTYRKWNTGFSNLVAMMAMPHEVEESLKVSDSSLPTPLSEEDSVVKIGDRVVQVADENDK